MRNIKLVLAYDGGPYHGWQVQPDLPTVQAMLRDALQRITGESILPQGSGRTDAGVHALEQVASFETTSNIPVDNFRKALNSHLPASVRILRVEDVANDFHARRSATAKTYQYRIFRNEICSPFLAGYVHHHPYPLDEQAMIDAAPLVVGEHDFTSFAAVDAEKTSAPDGILTSNVRSIFNSVWERRGEELIYTVRGNGFLHHMVRNIVGTFLLIGKGTLKSADIRRIIGLRDRSAAGATAPACGLYLVSVEY